MVCKERYLLHKWSSELELRKKSDAILRFQCSYGTMGCGEGRSVTSPVTWWLVSNKVRQPDVISKLHMRAMAWECSAHTNVHANIHICTIYKHTEVNIPSIWCGAHWLSGSSLSLLCSFYRVLYDNQCTYHIL